MYRLGKTLTLALFGIRWDNDEKRFLAKGNPPGRSKESNFLIKLPVLSTFYIYDEDEISEWYGVYGSFWEDRER